MDDLVDAARRTYKSFPPHKPVVEPFDDGHFRTRWAWFKGYDDAVDALCATICIADVLRGAGRRYALREMVRQAKELGLYEAEYRKKPPSAEAPGGRERGTRG